MVKSEMLLGLYYETYPRNVENLSSKIHLHCLIHCFAYTHNMCTIDPFMLTVLPDKQNKLPMLMTALRFVDFSLLINCYQVKGYCG